MTVERIVSSLVFERADDNENLRAFPSASSSWHVCGVVCVRCRGGLGVCGDWEGPGVASVWSVLVRTTSKSLPEGAEEPFVLVRLANGRLRSAEAMLSALDGRSNDGTGSERR